MGVSWGETVHMWAWIECWALLYHPHNPWTQNVRTWEQLTGEFVEPLPFGILKSLMDAIMRFETVSSKSKRKTRNRVLIGA